MCPHCLESLNLMAAALLGGADPKHLADAQAKVRDGIHVHDLSLSSTDMIPKMRMLIQKK